MIYLKEFIRNPIKTGAIAPSSASLAKLITKTANLEKTKSVVELGTGNGVFTEKILSKISPDCNFSSIEINANFVEKTRKRCPEAKVYHDSAENLKKYLANYNNQKCDCIISGLPWAAFDKLSQNRL
jgi:phospholipid N-methyltransferase